MKPFKTGMLALGLAFSVGVMAEPTRSPPSPDVSEAAEAKIDAQFKTDKEACTSMSGNTKDICVAEAKGREKVAKAELAARRKNSDKTRYDVLVAKAEAEYDVAKERCDDRSGNDKDVCIKDAKAALVTAKADAKTKFKTSEAMDQADEQVTQANRNAQEKSMDARRTGTEDKQDANYSAAKERCDSLAGETKDKCISDAKARYHQ